MRGHRVDEAGRQPAEAAVAEAGVGLLLEQAEPVEALLSRDGSLDERVEQQVGDVVGQRPADQELHRQVVDALGVLALVCLLRAAPSAGRGYRGRSGRPPRNARAVPAAAGSTTLSNIRCRSYSASPVPVNRIGPHPYCWKSLPMSGAFLPAALWVLASAAVVSLSITNPPLKRIADHLGAGSQVGWSREATALCLTSPHHSPAAPAGRGRAAFPAVFS